jgi:NTP pyrophosphatase (non-canonical NTP hydrolase)
MTINDYQMEALRTAAGMKHKDAEAMLLNGVMGMCGEAGECIDLLKKSTFQGHTLDREHMGKELGDVAWYIALSAYALDYTLEDILQMNVDKLRKRYPNGFEAARSLHREEGDV